MKIMVKVKELIVEELKGKHLYYVTVKPHETTSACNVTFGIALDKESKISYVQECDLQRLTITKEIFSFVSSHSKEVFIITLTDKSIKEVALIYG